MIDDRRARRRRAAGRRRRCRRHQDVDRRHRRPDRVLYEHVAPTDRSALVGQIAGLVDDARRQLGQDVAAVGVAIPGHVDPEDGSVSMAVNLGITHLPLGPLLEAELGVPTFVEHDARAAAAVAERAARPGAARAGERLAFLAIGTGISAGIVLDGALLRGDNGFAGEVGHVVADPEGVVCACGCAAASRRSPPARPSPARPTRRWRPVDSTILPPHVERRRRLPRRAAGDARRDRDHRPRGRPPGPGDPIARPDPRRQPRRHRRWRGRRRPPARTDLVAHRANARPHPWSRPPWAMRPSSCCRRPRRPVPAGRRRSLASASACLSERGWASDNHDGAIAGGRKRRGYDRGATRHPSWQRRRRSNT